MAKNPLEAKEYARMTGFDGKWRDSWWRRDFLEMMAERYQLSKVQHVLDVGCGVGHWGRILSQVLPDDVVLKGVDIEEDFVKRSTELASAASLKNFSYQKGSAGELPFEDNTFDFVTCQTLLIHVQDPDAALKEMKRVLKPGGLILAAEPNNISGHLNTWLAEPRPGWQDILKMIDFYHTCLVGKIELGMGDSSIGERLCGLYSELEFTQIDVAINENCPALFPPYEGEAQEIESKFVKDYVADGGWFGFGPRHNVLKLFKAGGGKESDFESYWALVDDCQQNIVKQIAEKRYAGGRAALMYIVTGRKPSSDS